MLGEALEPPGKLHDLGISIARIHCSGDLAQLGGRLAVFVGFRLRLDHASPQTISASLVWERYCTSPYKSAEFDVNFMSLLVPSAPEIRCQAVTFKLRHDLPAEAGTHASTIATAARWIP